MIAYHFALINRHSKCILTSNFHQQLKKYTNNISVEYNLNAREDKLEIVNAFRHFTNVYHNPKIIGGRTINFKPCVTRLEG